MTVEKVVNNPLPAYPVLIDKSATDADIQVVRLDLGVGTAESRLSTTNPMPVTGTITTTPGGTQDVNITKVGGGTVTTTLPVSGTVAATQGSSPWVVSGTVAATQGTSPWIVTANAGSNLNTSALALESGGNLAILSGGVASSVYQVNTKQINGIAPTMGNGSTTTGTQRVTLSSDSTGQVQLAAGTNVVGSLVANQSVNVAQIGSTNTSVNNGAVDAGTQRIVLPIGQGKTLLTASGSIAANGDNTIVNADATNRIKVFAFNFFIPGTTVITILVLDGSGGTELWRAIGAATVLGGITPMIGIGVNPPSWVFQTSVNKALIFNLSSANTVHYSIAYYKETT